MSDNKNENVVIAFYATAEAAEAAVETLKSWDKASDDVKLGAIGTMVVTPDGRIRTPVGSKAGKGAKVGAIVGIIALAFNLRPAAVSVGPVLQEIIRDMHMSATVAGLLTAMPVIAFSSFGALAPGLSLFGVVLYGVELQPANVVSFFTIWGLAAGFSEMRAAGLWRHAGPRLIAVEPFPRLAAVLAGKARPRWGGSTPPPTSRRDNLRVPTAMGPNDPPQLRVFAHKGARRPHRERHWRGSIQRSRGIPGRVFTLRHGCLNGRVQRLFLR